MTLLSDLDDDCLSVLFDRLPSEQLFKMRVNRRLNHLAIEKIRSKIKVISFIDSNSLFSECAHLNLINQNEVLVLRRKFKHDSINESIHDPSKRAFLLDLLEKCAGVKSIDFYHCKLPCNFLEEIVKRCPKLECLKIGESIIKEDEWNLTLDCIGQQIVHIVKERYGQSPLQGADLILIANAIMKCLNIKRVDWFMNGCAFTELLLLFRQLPETCWIRLYCDSFWDDENDDFYEDVVDDLEIQTFNWFAFGPKNYRLKNLKLQRVEVAYNRIEFNGLKKLDFIPEEDYNYEAVECLITSRFPCLEEFCFSVSGGLSECDFDNLFPRMPWVKKLTMFYQLQEGPYLPRSAILELQNLETIRLQVETSASLLGDESMKMELKSLIKHIKMYVDEIGSLKKLTIDMPNCELEEWRRTMEEKVERIKLKQDRVEIVLFL